MIDISCKDAQGCPLKSLTQWDINQVAVITGVDLTECISVRFSNVLSKVSLVVRPAVLDDALHIDIPNILLQQPHPITINIIYEYDGSSKSRYIFTIPVIPSPCPEDYMPVNNVDYVSWVELENEARMIIAELEQDHEVIVISEDQPVKFDTLWFNSSESSELDDRDGFTVIEF